MAKYAFNERFFQNIDTEEKAYWLGFLYADGCVRIREIKQVRGRCVSYHKSYGLCLKLNEIDENHLEKFLKSLNSPHPIRRNTTEPQYPLVEIWNKPMVEDLINHGVVPRKSYRPDLPLPDLEESLYRHFLRGWFDGDGCFSLTSGSRSCVWMVAGHENPLNDMNSRIPVSSKVSLHSGSLYQIMIHGIDRMSILFPYLYSNASVWLDRKREKFETYFKLWDIDSNQLIEDLKLIPEHPGS